MTPDSQKPDNDRSVTLRDLEALREEIRAIREEIRNLYVPRIVRGEAFDFIRQPNLRRSPTPPPW